MFDKLPIYSAQGPSDEARQVFPNQTLIALQTFSPPIFTENLISRKTLRVLREINNFLEKIIPALRNSVIGETTNDLISSFSNRIAMPPCLRSMK